MIDKFSVSSFGWDARGWKCQEKDWAKTKPEFVGPADWLGQANCLATILLQVAKAIEFQKNRSKT